MSEQQSPLAEAIAGMQEAARIMDDPRSIATERFARLNAIAEAEEDRVLSLVLATIVDPEERAALQERWNAAGSDA